MFLHFVPKIFTDAKRGEEPRLSRLEIREAGILLSEGRQLATRTPMPNKHWLVGTDASVRRAHYGLLIDVGDVADKITVVSHWTLADDGVIEHVVLLDLLDRKHDVIATTNNTWQARANPDWKWKSVVPGWAEDLGGLDTNPSMEVAPGNLSRPAAKQVEDTVLEGRLTHRQERLSVPTIERERYNWISNNSDYRLPTYITRPD